MRPIALLFLAVPLAACGNSYHPEYHPVTVTNVQQTYSSPVHVDGAARPVVIAPASSAQAPIVLGAVTPDPPPGFFDH